jgi:hypothetical protein
LNINLCFISMNKWTLQQMLNYSFLIFCIALTEISYKICEPSTSNFGIVSECLFF